jgi:L-ascorbate metabolism protein UlaG (beta-lactamase superfamily)
MLPIYEARGEKSVPDIQYLGHACFRLRGREGVLICDPFDQSTGLDLGRPTAHIVTISHHHPDHAYVDGVRPVGELPRTFVVDGPGEYEVRGVLISGVRTYHDKEKGAQLGFNTVYVLHLDEVTFCHLGDLGHELTAEQLDEIGNVDVLFVPVGSGTTIGPAEAASVISQIEPRIVIPMHYANPHLSADYQLAPLEKFLNEMGMKDATPEEKVSVTAASLPKEGEEMRTIVMQAERG